MALSKHMPGSFPDCHTGTHASFALIKVAMGWLVFPPYAAPTVSFVRHKQDGRNRVAHENRLL
jgi:hypothetical protein